MSGRYELRAALDASVRPGEVTGSRDWAEGSACQCGCSIRFHSEDRCTLCAVLRQGSPNHRFEPKGRRRT